MSQLQIARTGPPAEVTELLPQDQPIPGPGEVLVRMIAAAVNPADLNFIEGTYGSKPPLPCVPGMEGSGVIEALGDGVSDAFPDMKPGLPVLPLLTPGNWATWRVLPAEQIFVLPEGIDPLQAALMRVNPPTACGLLHVAGAPEAGGWVAQNAASSAAGHCVIQIAQRLGLKTLNFVRRAESIPVCEALGADLVFTDDTEGLAAAKAALAERGALPTLALNAVGGDSALAHPLESQRQTRRHAEALPPTGPMGYGRPTAPGNRRHLPPRRIPRRPRPRRPIQPQRQDPPYLLASLGRFRGFRCTPPTAGGCFICLRGDAGQVMNNSL